MDLKHLEPVKAKGDGRSPGPNKWWVRCDYVMAIRRGWQDETMWEYDAKKGRRMPYGFLAMEYIQFDTTNGAEITMGTDHSIVYCITKRQRGGTS